MSSTVELSEKAEKERLYQKEYRAKNKEKISAYNAQYRRNNREAIRAKERVRYGTKIEHVSNYNLKRLYGITTEERDALFLSQGDCCAICGTTERSDKRSWHLDHCHRTKQVRGVLCRHCNLLLGYARDNSAILAAAIAYLGKFDNGGQKEAAC